MQFLDFLTLDLLVFSPLIAAIFIMLIPTVDTGSKLAISRFFALLGIITFAKLFYSFINHEYLDKDIFSFSVGQLDIRFAINLTKQNIFLYGAASAALLANMYFYEFNDTKSNMHQVAPFLLTFALYITFGQSDLRIALPIISISNFIVYFLIGFGSKIQRGSTIFQMGITLFTCDALALVLLQYQSREAKNSLLYTALHFALVLPGLSRLCLPMCAPFMRKLFLNVDDTEGPFLLSFLQLSGFSILLSLRNQIGEIPPQFSLVIALVATISSLYVAILAVSEPRKKIMPYFFLAFYSSMSAATLFISQDNIYSSLAISLLLTNIACFFQATKSSLMLYEQSRTRSMYQAKLRGNWFISLGLMTGIPAFGIGTTLWPVIYIFAQGQEFASESGYRNTWAITGIIWGLSLLLLSFALMKAVNNNVSRISKENNQAVSDRASLEVWQFSSWFFIVLLSWLIPLATIVVSSNF